MRGSQRSLRVLAAPLLVAVAILGYLVGHGHPRPAPAPAPPEAAGHTILTSSLLLTYPSGWAPAKRATVIPSLAITSPVLVAPGGDGAKAGLLTGQLIGGEASPLPAQFIARLLALPATSVVNLPETQAYRYSNLSIPGLARALTLYAIPNPGANPTALACYAASAASWYMRACEQIVASLRLQLAPQNYILTPDADYARKVSASLAAVDAQRAILRHKLHVLGPQPAAQPLAASLARTMAGASASLSALQAPPAASQAQAMLSGALGRARQAYTALAAAASAGSRSDYLSARGQVYAAEASIAVALHGFALLGYQQA
jgi:hypothetical protein